MNKAELFKVSGHYEKYGAGHGGGFYVNNVHRM